MKTQHLLRDALWPMFWRAVLLLPIAFLGSVCVIAACFAAVVLPIVAGFYLWASEWWLAGMCVVAEVPAILVARWVSRQGRGSNTKDDEGVLI